MRDVIALPARAAMYLRVSSKDQERHVESGGAAPRASSSSPARAVAHDRDDV
jgi:hypothetical protein